MSFNVGSVVGAMKFKLNEWRSSITTVKKDITDITAVAKKSEAQINKMGRTAKVVGIAAAVAFTGFVKASTGLNREIANVATLMPKAKKEIYAVKREVQDLSIKYAKSTSDLSGGAYQVVSAFGAQAASSAKLDLTARAAAAGMATTTEALNLLSAVTKGYGDVSDTAYRHASDLAFMTVKMGQTTFPELSASIGRTVPTAVKMGVSVEELHAGFATLTGVTGSAAEVSTQMAGILRAMIKPTTGMKAAIRKLGFETAESMVSQLGMVGSLKALIGTTDGTTESVGKLFRRAEALTAVFALTGSQAATFKEKFEAMKNATGATDEAFKEITSGINKTGFALEQAKQRAAVMAQKMGDSLIPAVNTLLAVVNPAVSLLTGMAEGFSQIPAPVRVVTTGFVGLTAATIALSVAKAKFMVLVGKLPAKLATLLKAMGPYLAAITAGYAAYTAIKKAAEAAGRAQYKHAAAIQETAEREQKIFSELHTFKKQAAGRDIELWKKSAEVFMSLSEKSYEERLKAQRDFLLKHSANFKKFLEGRKKVQQKSIEKEKCQTEEQYSNISSILNAAKEKHMQYTLDEYNFRVWKAQQAFSEEKKILLENRASKEQFLELQRGYNAELAQIENDRLTSVTQRYREENAKRLESGISFYEYQKELRLQYDEFLREQEEIVAIEALTGREREIAELQRFHEAQRASLQGLLRAKVVTAEQYVAQRVSQERRLKEETEKIQNEEHKSWISRLNDKLKKGYEYFNLMFSSFSSYLNAKQKKLDAEYERERKWIEENIKNEADRKAALENLDNEYAEKKRKIQRQQAIIEKASNISSAIMNTATAATKAYTAGPIIGPILAGIITAMGLAQVALIARTPIPFAVGGMAKKEGLAYLHEREVVMPYERAVHIEKNNALIEKHFSGVQAYQGEARGEGGTTIIFNISTLDAYSFEEFFASRCVPLIEQYTRSENLLIYKGSVRENM